MRFRTVEQVSGANREFGSVMEVTLLPIERINRIFARHYGSKRALARELGLSYSAITKALRRYHYGYSPRIHEAADRHARQYLAFERAKKRKTAQQAQLNHPAEHDQAESQTA